MSQARRTCSITSGLSGSPAEMHSRRLAVSQLARSAWISIRHTVGGAHSVLTPQPAIAVNSASTENRSCPSTNAVAPAFHGANTFDQACLAQPGEETLRCTSPGCRPSQYMVDRWPIGYETCVCSTSLGWAVVPEV